MLVAIRISGELEEQTRLSFQNKAQSMLQNEPESEIKINATATLHTERTELGYSITTSVTCIDATCGGFFYMSIWVRL